MVAETKEAKVMERIRNLLAIANNAPEGDPERESALKAANAMMMRHAIDMAQLDAERDPSQRRRPIHLKFKMYEDDSVTDWWAELRTIMNEIIVTNRCRGAFHYGTAEVTIVGMAEDVEWCQMLWMQVFFDFVSKINPSWDTSKSLGDNILAFKHAGYKWNEIWEIGYRAEGQLPDSQDHFNTNRTQWMVREYRKARTAAGLDAVSTQRHGAYRKTFVTTFKRRICERLEIMRAENKTAGSGSELALMGVDDRVRDEYYILFPQFSPEAMEAMRRKLEEQEAREKAADEAYLASLTPTQRRRVLEARAAEERKQARENDRYWREQQKRNEKQFDSAGARAGYSAANEVSLEKGNVQATSGERTQIGG